NVLICIIPKVLEVVVLLFRLIIGLRRVMLSDTATRRTRALAGCLPGANHLTERNKIELILK
ncbi:hypothetical protein, partial [Klebsiella pneumoniae]|uniref:hypothetical protein n=1 Tax=Klebsiella pneumoniae TaxID=573 RepID=UPI0039C40468